ILRLAGWDRQTPLWDPLCGSGTFAVEAAMWARVVAPRLGPDRFGFERWTGHDDSAPAATADLRGAARARIRTEGPTIRASDVDERAVLATRRCARVAKVRVLCERADIAQLEPRDPEGFVIVNPPYGQRLEPDRELYRT